MIEPSAISMALHALRAQLEGCWQQSAGGGQSPVLVNIGHPAAAAKLAEQNDSAHIVNLFVHRIEHGGYPADGTPDDPLFVKLSCIITSFARQENEQAGGSGTTTVITAGEMDLRIIGHCMQRLNERPMLYLPEGAKAASPEITARLQIVPAQLSADEMNKIWSMQSETSYRPSVGYELALLPVPVKERPMKAEGVVGRIGMQIRPDMAYVPPARFPEGFGIRGSGPAVAPAVVNICDPAWTPQICFIDDQGLPATTLLARGTAAGKVKIYVAGVAQAENVSIMRQAWDNSKGWQEPEETISKAKVNGDRIDPKVVISDEGTMFDTPAAPGHFLIYAQRTWERPTDKKKIKLRSNPLLLTTIAEKAQ